MICLRTDKQVKSGDIEINGLVKRRYQEHPSSKLVDCVLLI